MQSKFDLEGYFLRNLDSDDAQDRLSFAELEFIYNFIFKNDIIKLETSFAREELKIAKAISTPLNVFVKVITITDSGIVVTITNSSNDGHIRLTMSDTRKVRAKVPIKNSRFEYDCVAYLYDIMVETGVTERNFGVETTRDELFSIFGNHKKLRKTYLEPNLKTYAERNKIKDKDFFVKTMSNIIISAFIVYVYTNE